MSTIEHTRALLNQASTMAYEAYGRYFSIHCPWGENEVMSYHEWLERDGKYYKFLVESMQQHLIELIYQSNMPSITISVEQWNSLKGK